MSHLQYLERWVLGDDDTPATADVVLPFTLNYLFKIKLHFKSHLL